MSKGTTSALIDFVMDNPMEGLNEVDLSTAKGVLLELISKGCDPSLVATCVCHYQKSDMLLGIVARQYRHAERESFLRGVASQDREVWKMESEGDGLNPWLVYEAFSSLQDAEIVIKDKTLRAIFTDQNHPLCDMINVDAYWEKHVRWFFTRHQVNFKRAWGEFEKAVKGFTLNPLSQRDRLSAIRSGRLVSAEPRYLRLQPEKAFALAIEIYDAMHKRGNQVRPIQQADYEHPRQSEKVSDWNFVARVCDRDPSGLSLLWPGPVHCRVLFRHFADLRDERRRTKRGIDS